jgi:hypothetical protein
MRVKGCRGGRRRALAGGALRKENRETEQHSRRSSLAGDGESGCPQKETELRQQRRSLLGQSAPPFSQKKWGPALLPAPTAPSEGSAGVRNLVDRTLRLTNPLSILAHQLRRRFPSDRSLQGRSSTNLLDCAARRFAGLSTRPACPLRT